MNPNHTIIPAEVDRLLRAAFPDQLIGDVAATSGGFSNLTASAKIGEQRCVIKAATAPLKRADVRREARVLALLRDSELPVPALITLIEDENWTIAITRYVQGTHGLQVLEHTPDQLMALYNALGKLLAAVHRTPLATEDPELLLDQRSRYVMRELPTLNLDAELAAPLTASLAHPIWQSDARCLAHGDAGLHNLLWDGRITALLDWEWAGWGTPLLDLAWLAWTMRWRNLPPELWQTFLAGYGDGPALAHASPPDALRALALGQIAGILLRVQHQPAAQAEWLRRLRWTLGIEFPGLGGRGTGRQGDKVTR